MTFAIPALIGAQAGLAAGTALGVGASVGAGLIYGGAAFGIYASYDLLGTSLPDGPRQDRHGRDRITTRDEGAPSIRAWGKTAPVPGHMLWEQWPLEEIKHSNNSGKGPGAGGEYLTYTYNQSVAIEWRKCYGDPISQVLFVKANGHQVFDTTPDADESSTLIAANKSTTFISVGVATAYYYHYATYVTTSAGPDLTQFKAGLPLEISGFTETAYNGTYEVVSNKLKVNGDTEVKVLLSEGASSTHPAASNEAAGNSITLFQSFPAFSKKDYEEVTHYLGTLTQTKDPTIAAFEGDDGTPAYRDRAYSMFKDWRLTNYGNMIPQTWTAILECDPNATVQQPVDALLISAGVTEFDTSAIADIPLDGFVTDTRTAPLESLAQLALAYDLMMTDQGGVLTVEPRATVAEVTIEQADLAAHVPGERPPRDIQHEPVVSRDLPAAVTVSYIDPAKDYEPGAETYVLQGATSGRVELVELDVVMSSAQAQAIARRVAWSAQAGGHAMSGIQLPPSLLGTVRPGTLAHLPDGTDLLIGSVLVGINDVLQVAGAEEQRQTLTHATESAAPGGN